MTTVLELIPLEKQVWADDGVSMELMLPKGTRLVKVDPSGEAEYLQLKVSVLQLCEDLGKAPLTCVFERKQLEIMLGKVQNVRRAVEAERKKKAVVVDELKGYVQDVYKKALIDPLDDIKAATNARLDKFNNDMILADAEEKRRIAEAQKAASPKPEEEILDPEFVQPAPKTSGVVVDVKTSRTEAGTRFSKKTVEHEVIDFEALPAEFKKLVVDYDKLAPAINKAAEGITEPCTREDLVKGVRVKVFWKGQLRG